jgi:hypothetical protein
MAMLKKVKAVMRTLVAISSVQEIPELKKYLRMTLTEIIISWRAKKMHARMALMKWSPSKIRFTLMGQIPPRRVIVKFVKIVKPFCPMVSCGVVIGMRNDFCGDLWRF